MAGLTGSTKNNKTFKFWRFDLSVDQLPPKGVFGLGLMMGVDDKSCGVAAILFVWIVSFNYNFQQTKK